MAKDNKSEKKSGSKKGMITCERTYVSDRFSRNGIQQDGRRSSSSPPNSPIALRVLDVPCRHHRRGAVREKRTVSLDKPRPAHQRIDNAYVETPFVDGAASIQMQQDQKQEENQKKQRKKAVAIFSSIFAKNNKFTSSSVRFINNDCQPSCSTDLPAMKWSDEPPPRPGEGVIVEFPPYVPYKAELSEQLDSCAVCHKCRCSTCQMQCKYPGLRVCGKVDVQALCDKEFVDATIACMPYLEKTPRCKSANAARARAAKMAKEGSAAAAPAKTATTETAPAKTASATVAPVKTATAETAFAKTAPAAKTSTAETAIEETAPIKRASAASAPEKTTPAKTAITQTATAETAPIKRASAASAPEKTAPTKTATAETAPIKRASAASAPEKTAPAKTAIIKTATAETAIKETAITKTASTPTTPVKTAPADSDSASSVKCRLRWLMCCLCSPCPPCRMADEPLKCAAGCRGNLTVQGCKCVNWGGIKRNNRSHVNASAAAVSESRDRRRCHRYHITNSPEKKSMFRRVLCL